MAKHDPNTPKGDNDPNLKSVACKKKFQAVKTIYSFGVELQIASILSTSHRSLIWLGKVLVEPLVKRTDEL